MTQLHDTLSTVKQNERPFLQSIEHGTIGSPFYRWQTDVNEKGETFARTNRTQISTKLIRSSEIQAGKDDLAYLLIKHGTMLLRDIEAVLLNNQGVREAQAEQAPRLAGVPTWIESHAFTAPDGANATRHECGCHTARVDGTPRPLTEPMLIELLEAVPAADLLVVPGIFKPLLAGFSIVELPPEPRDDTRLHNHIYKLGAREVPLVFDSFTRLFDIFAIEREMWALQWFRKIEAVELGDKSNLLVAEYTLECRDESRNGGLFDLNPGAKA